MNDNTGLYLITNVNLHSYFSSRLDLQSMIMPTLKDKIRITPVRLALYNKKITIINTWLTKVRLVSIFTQRIN